MILLLLVAATGLSVSFIAARLGAIAGWNVPEPEGGGWARFSLLDLALAALAGPHLLLAGLPAQRRQGQAGGVVAAAAGAALGWAVLLGIVVLQVAGATGLFDR